VIVERGRWDLDLLYGLSVQGVRVTDITEFAELQRFGGFAPRLRLPVVASAAGHAAQDNPLTTIELDANACRTWRRVTLGRVVRIVLNQPVH
jgi:hypothetical protein